MVHGQVEQLTHFREDSRGLASGSARSASTGRPGGLAFFLGAAWPPVPPVAAVVPGEYASVTWRTPRSTAPASLTWSEVTGRRMARHWLTEPANGLGPAEIAGVLCGAHAPTHTAGCQASAPTTATWPLAL